MKHVDQCQTCIKLRKKPNKIWYILYLSLKCQMKSEIQEKFIYIYIYTSEDFCGLHMSLVTVPLLSFGNM